MKSLARQRIHIPLALVLVLAFGVSVACGGSQTPPAPAGDNAGASTTRATAADTAGRHHYREHPHAEPRPAGRRDPATTAADKADADNASDRHPRPMPRRRNPRMSICRKRAAEYAHRLVLWPSQF